MADVFGFTNYYGDQRFASPDVAKAAFTLNEKNVSLVQQWNVQYQLNVQPIFECGSQKVYFSAKHANGTLQLGRIVAEKPTDLLNGFGKFCKDKDGNLTAAEACNKTSTVKLTFKHIVLNSIGFSGQAQNAFVGEDIGIMFAGLESK